MKTLYTDTFIKAKFFIMSVVFAQMYQFSLNLSSLQQKFSLTSIYLGTNTVVVKRVDCIPSMLRYFLVENSLVLIMMIPGEMMQQVTSHLGLHCLLYLAIKLT